MKETIMRMLQQRMTSLQQEFQQAQTHFMQVSGQLKEVETLMGAVNSMDEPKAEVVADDHNQESA